MDIGCQVPPPLPEDELHAVLDGSGSDETHEHLRRCPSCVARLRALGAVDRLLRRISRYECPSPHVLADYHASFLDAAAVSAVRRHVDSCPRCKEELQVLTTFLDDEATHADDTRRDPPNLIRPPHMVWRAQRVEWDELAAARGLEEPTTYDVTANSATVYLEARQGDANVVFSGQVIDATVDWRSAIAEIRQSGTIIQVTHLDDSCEFQFQVAPLPFDLSIVTLDGTILSVEQLDPTK